MRIITDTGALFTPTQGQELGIDVLPLNVIINKKSYMEFVDIQSDEFIELVKQGNVPSSSQPSIGMTMELFEKYKDEDVLVINMADGLSGTYQSTLGIKESMEHHENIHVINSMTLCSFIALLLIAFVVLYFINHKKQEFSILLLSGRTPKDLFVYLMIQFGILLAISFTIGIIGGNLIIYIINKMINLTTLPYHLSYSLLGTIGIYFCFFIIAILLILAVGSNQFVNLDLQLAKYLSANNTNKTPAYTPYFSAYNTKKRFPLITILSSLFILYFIIINISRLFDTQLPIDKLLMSFCYILAGEVLIINSTIPLLYDMLHNKFLLKHPVLIHSLSQFIDFSKTMSVLINLNASIVPFLLFILFFSSNNSFIQIIIIPCFSITIVMIALCFYLRYSIYNQTIIQSTATLQALGYSYQRLRTISLIKIILFALFSFIIPLFLLSTLFYKAYLDQFLSINIIIGLISFYFVTYFLIIINMIIKERKTLKEVVQNVKYLNRG